LDAQNRGLDACACGKETGFPAEDGARLFVGR